MNLGAGAELGIYEKAIDVNGFVHYKYNPDLMMPMTLRLVDNRTDKDIFNYPMSGTKDFWWITGFRPSYQEVLACNLTAHYTVNFSKKQDLYWAFKAYNEDRRVHPWEFYDDTHIATLKF